jgi:hypothetical protein
MKKKTALTIGLWGLLGGPLFAFSPLALAWLSTPPGGNMWSEGGGGGGSSIWLMFLTIPFGFIALIVGLIFTIIGLATKS